MSLPLGQRQLADEFGVIGCCRALLDCRGQCHVIAIPQRFGVQPQTGKDTGAEQAVRTRLNNAILAFHQFIPHDLAFLGLHYEVFAHSTAL